MNLPLLVAVLLLSPANPGGDAAGALVEADLLLAQIDYRSAEQSLRQTLRDSPEDPDIHWRLARVHVLTAEVTSGGQHLLHLRAAEHHARQAIALDPGISQGYTWLAAALGYRALLSPSDEQLDLLEDLLGASARAIQLNPADDIAFSIRGSTYRALGNIGWLHRSIATLLFGAVPEGGFEEAESALQTAVRIAPNIMRHRYELGILMLDMGREEEARQILTEASSLPQQIASDIPRLETIRELLSMEHPTSPPPVNRGSEE